MRTDGWTGDVLIMMLANDGIVGLECCRCDVIFSYMSYMPRTCVFSFREESMAALKRSSKGAPEEYRWSTEYSFLATYTFF